VEIVDLAPEHDEPVVSIHGYKAPTEEAEAGAEETPPRALPSKAVADGHG